MTTTRATTYDGTQLEFMFPSSNSGSWATPSISTETNTTYPISQGMASYAATTTSLKRTKAIRSKIGWLSRKLQTMGHRFFKGLKKRWRVISSKKRALFRRKSSGGSALRRRFEAAAANTKASMATIKDKNHQGYSSIVELRREIDHWRASPPAPPPHKVISPVSLEDAGSVKMRKLRSREGSIGSVRYTNMTLNEPEQQREQQEQVHEETKYELHELLNGYFKKIITDRIQTRLNIAKLERIPQKRQDSFIRNEILNSYLLSDEEYQQQQLQQREPSRDDDSVDLEESDSEDRSEVMSEASYSNCSMSTDHTSINSSLVSYSVTGTETYSDYSNGGWTDISEGSNSSIMDSEYYTAPDECFQSKSLSSSSLSLSTSKKIPRSPAFKFNLRSSSSSPRIPTLPASTHKKHQSLKIEDLQEYGQQYAQRLNQTLLRSYTVPLKDMGLIRDGCVNGEKNWKGINHYTRVSEYVVEV